MKLFQGILVWALTASVSQAWSQGRGVVHSPTPQQEIAESNVGRRACLGVLASLSTGLWTAGSAHAFDNKISNKYDDRPKRRGPRVSCSSSLGLYRSAFSISQKCILVLAQRFGCEYSHKHGRRRVSRTQKLRSRAQLLLFHHGQGRRSRPLDSGMEVACQFVSLHFV